MDKHDAWKTQFSDPKIHEENGCSKCHEYHLDKDQVDDNSQKGYSCCVDQIAEWIKEQKRCAIHPHAYFESVLARMRYGLGFKSMCEGCNQKWREEL